MGLNNNLINIIGQLKDFSFLEIGVAEGNTAYKVVNMDNCRSYVGIDPYKPYREPAFREAKHGFLDIKLSQEKFGDIDKVWDKIYHDTCKRINLLNKKTAKIIRGYSHEVASSFKKNSFDVIFIDGNHQYDYVLKDLEIYFEILRPGGLLIGDDFEFHGGNRVNGLGGRKACEVDKAVLKFCKDKNLDFNVYPPMGNYVIVKPIIHINLRPIGKLRLYMGILLRDMRIWPIVPKIRNILRKCGNFIVGNK